MDSNRPWGCSQTAPMLQLGYFATADVSACTLIGKEKQVVIVQNAGILSNTTSHIESCSLRVKCSGMILSSAALLLAPGCMRRPTTALLISTAYPRKARNCLRMPTGIIKWGTPYVNINADTPLNPCLYVIDLLLSSDAS